MTREELTARLRKLTGKTATDIESLDERVDALEAGAGGGGVEFNTLDVTVTYTGQNHMFVGFITSEIPNNIEINNIIKIEHVEVQIQGENTTSIIPLPTLDGRPNLNNEFTLTGYEIYAQMTDTGVTMPLGLVFQKIDTNSELTELTVNYKITYV